MAGSEPAGKPPTRSGSRPPGSPGSPGSPTRRRVSFTFVCGVVVALAVIILAAQNTAHARFHFLWWHASSPLVVIILGAALAGVVLDELVGAVWRVRRRREARRVSRGGGSGT